jgi:tRNA nucleotidyltransferase (CCA-adding enzyme)
MRLRTDHLLARLDDEACDDERRALAAVRRVAGKHGLETYLVGGSVRDLILGRPSTDRDVTVVGDAVSLAQDVARRLGVPHPVIHPTFGTATLRVGTINLDLITARRETYPHPGALPVVEPSTLADDLARRDFTINAMALGLTGPHTSALIDPHGGLDDLRAGRIRVLHARSFQDDATRLLRAARYAARFRFEMEDGTRRAAHADRGYLTTISPARVRHELVRIFAKRLPGPALAVVQALGLPDVLIGGLRFSRGVLRGYDRMSDQDRREGLVPWLLPILRWKRERIHVYVERLALTHHEARAAEQVPDAMTSLRRLVRTGAPPSAIVATLERTQPAVLLAVLLAMPRSSVAAVARRYLDHLRSVRPRLTSDDLIARGVPRGPIFGQILRALRAARLDDPAFTLDAETRLVQHMLREHVGG